MAPEAVSTVLRWEDSGGCMVVAAGDFDALAAQNQQLSAIVEIVARRRAAFRHDGIRSEEEQTLDALLAEWGAGADTWKDGFVDARFSVREAAEWERLVSEGLDREAATVLLIKRRRLLDG
jgi:hypothetical protein